MEYIARPSPQMASDRENQTFKPQIKYEEFAAILEECEETPDSKSPYKVSFFNRTKSYRPDWNQFLQIVLWESIMFKDKVPHLNEIYLDETPVRLCVDVDTAKGFDGDLSALEDDILSHIENCVEMSVATDKIELEIIYNSATGHARVYTNLVILGKHRTQFHLLLQELSPPNLRAAAKFDGNPMMRSLFSYKRREQTEEEKASWVFSGDKENKVADLEKGCYIKQPGKRRDLMIQYSGFVPEGTPVLAIKQKYAAAWNVTKIRATREEKLEKILAMEQLGEDNIDLVLAEMDFDSENWKAICQALKNFGATGEQLREWSSQSTYQYDDKARAYLDSIEDPNKRSPYGWNTLISNGLTDETLEKINAEKKTAYISKSIDSLFKLGSEDVKVEEFEDAYVRPLKFCKKALAIKAKLGKGKTTAFIQHIDKHRYDSILVITPRISFADSIFERLGRESDYEFNHYRQRKGAEITANYVVCQNESLHRVSRSFELIVIDECESVLYQSTSNTTHRENMGANFSKLKGLLMGSRRILCMDAFLTNRTLDFLTGMKIPVEVQSYTREQQLRTYVDVGEKENLISHLIADLRAGKKIYFFCSSKKKITDVFRPTIQKAIPEIKIAEYHSDRKLKRVNVNEEWLKFDIVMTTATNTVGINFDLDGGARHFHKIYVYASAASHNLVRDIFQSTYRVRHLIDDQLVFYLDVRTMGFSQPYSFDPVSKEIKLREDSMRKSLGAFIENGVSYEMLPPDLRALAVWNVTEANISIMKLKAMFYRYLRECNYIAEEENMPAAEQIDLLNTPCEFAYDDIAGINPNECHKLRLKRSAQTSSLEENAQIERFFYDYVLMMKSIPVEVKRELWPLFIKYKEVFWNVCYEKAIEFGTIDLKIAGENDAKEFSIFAKGMPQRLSIIAGVMEKLGKKNSQDYDEEKIGYELINGLTEHLKAVGVNNIRSVFNIRKGRGTKFDTRDAITLANLILEKWSKSKLVQRGTQCVNGKQKKTFVLRPVEEMSCIYPSIKPRFAREDHEDEEVEPETRRKKVDFMIFDE